MCQEQEFSQKCSLYCKLTSYVFHFRLFFAKTNTRFFYKQHFYKQRQAEIGKKLSKI